MTIVRSLLAAKLDGQAALLRDLSGRREAAAALHEAAGALSDATTIADLRFIESRAAAIYWDAWTGLPMRFATRDRTKVPAHWLAFDTRRSQLGSSPRKASNPTNAILNYLYGIVEAEAHVAALRVAVIPRSASFTPIDRTGPASPAISWNQCGPRWMPWCSNSSTSAPS